MTPLLRILAAAALLAPAFASAQTAVPPSLQVSRLAPQLVAFAGGQTNFDSLVNGLASGTPVSLVSALPNGQVQTVSFTPQGTMSPTQIAQTLESARQGLISRGIATPTGQQLSVALVGGGLATQTGTAQVAGVLPAANQPVSAAAGGSAATTPITTTTTGVPVNPNGTPSPAALIQGQTGAAGAGATPPSPARIIQNQRGSNISDTPTPGNISNTPSTTAPAQAPAAAPSTPAPLAPAAPSAGSAPFAAPAR